MFEKKVEIYFFKKIYISGIKKKKMENILDEIKSNKISPDLKSLNDYYSDTYHELIQKHGSKTVFGFISRFARYIGFTPQKIDLFLRKYIGSIPGLNYVIMKYIDNMLISPIVDDIDRIISNEYDAYEKRLDTSFEILSRKIYKNLFDLSNTNNRHCLIGTFLLREGPNYVNELYNRVVSSEIKQSDKQLILGMVTNLLSTTKTILKNVYEPDVVKNIMFSKIKSPLLQGLDYNIRNVNSLPFPNLDEKYQKTLYPSEKIMKLLTYKGMKSMNDLSGGLLQSFSDKLGMTNMMSDQYEDMKDVQTDEQMFNFICEKNILDTQSALNEFSEDVQNSYVTFQENVVDELNKTTSTATNTLYSSTIHLIMIGIFFMILGLFTIPCRRRRVKKNKKRSK